MQPKLMLFKRLNIQASGAVSGGYVQYNADDQTGVITYNAEVDVHFLFFSKSFPFAGATTIDASLLKSVNLTPGKQINIGTIQIDVVSVDKGVARCTVSIVNGSVKGSGDAYFDVSKDEISLQSLSMDGSVPIIGNIHLEVSQ